MDRVVTGLAVGGEKERESLRYRKEKQLDMSNLREIRAVYCRYS